MRTARSRRLRPRRSSCACASSLVGHKNRAGRPGPKGIGQLLGSKYWPKLEALRLPNCGIADAGARLLAAAPSLCKLEELDVEQNDLLSKGIMALARSPYLANLRRLIVRSNKVGIAGIKAIAATKFLTKLEHVDTSMTWLNDRDVQPIEDRFPGALVHNRPR